MFRFCRFRTGAGCVLDQKIDFAIDAPFACENIPVVKARAREILTLQVPPNIAALCSAAYGFARSVYSFFFFLCEPFIHAFLHSEPNYLIYEKKRLVSIFCFFFVGFFLRLIFFLFISWHGSSTKGTYWLPRITNRLLFPFLFFLPVPWKDSIPEAAVGKFDQVRSDMSLLLFPCPCTALLRREKKNSNSSTPNPETPFSAPGVESEVKRKPCKAARAGSGVFSV